MQEKERLREDNENIRNQLTEANTRLANNNADDRDVQIPISSAQINQLNNISTLNRKIEELQKNLSNVTNNNNQTINKLNDEINKYKNDLENRRLSERDAISRANQIERDRDKLISEIEKKYNSDIKNLLNKLETNENDNNKLKTLLNDNTAKLRQIDKEKNDLQILLNKQKIKPAESLSGQLKIINKSKTDDNKLIENLIGSINQELNKSQTNPNRKKVIHGKNKNISKITDDDVVDLTKIEETKINPNINERDPLINNLTDFPLTSNSDVNTVVEVLKNDKNFKKKSLSFGKFKNKSIEQIVNIVTGDDRESWGIDRLPTLLSELEFIRDNQLMNNVDIQNLIDMVQGKIDSYNRFK
jgi:chromosome segregation ATPase